MPRSRARAEAHTDGSIPVGCQPRSWAATRNEPVQQPTSSTRPDLDDRFDPGQRAAGRLDLATLLAQRHLVDRAGVGGGDARRVRLGAERAVSATPALHHAAGGAAVPVGAGSERVRVDPALGAVGRHAEETLAVVAAAHRARPAVALHRVDHEVGAADAFAHAAVLRVDLRGRRQVEAPDVGLCRRNLREVRRGDQRGRVGRAERMHGVHRVRA